MSSSAEARRRVLLGATLAAAAGLLFSRGPALGQGAGGHAGDADLARAIASAVDRGRDALLPRFEAQLRKGVRDYPMGRIALSLAALLKAGLSPAHELAGRGFKQLAAMKPVETYSVACYLMALDALNTRLVPVAGTAAGRAAPAPAAPAIPEAARARMKELVAWLIDGSGGTWTYGGRGNGDLSNTQFAVLGLEVALENDVQVPAEVFRAVAERLVEAQILTRETKLFDIKYVFPGWAGVTPASTRSIERTARLLGWNYEFNTGYRPSASMTAAGVSSLLIARRGLKRAGAYDDALAARVDKAITGGLGWIAKRLKSYTETHYALYSLEKAADIASILLLDRVDWYAAGARFLIATQDTDGSWRDEVDTALALLFLTRATRMRLLAHGPPIFITGASEAGAGAGPENDLVYVDAANGFVSLAALFEFFEESRSEKLIPLISRAIDKYPPQRSGECLARLISVWTEDDDAASRFARAKAEEIAGLKQDRAALQRAARNLQRVRELEAARGADPAAVAELFANAEGTALKLRLIDLVDRHGLAAAFDQVIEEVGGREEAVRRRAEEALERWTKAGLAPRSAEERAARSPEAAATRWRNWWNVNGQDLVGTRSMRLIAERIARGEDAGRIEAAIEEAAGAGPDMARHLLEAMGRGEYSIHLVRALERVTGLAAGLRAEDWKEAIEKGGR